LVDLLRVKLHLAGERFGNNQMIVAEGLENALFVDVDLHLALRGVDGIDPVALRYQCERGETQRR